MINNWFKQVFWAIVHLLWPVQRNGPCSIRFGLLRFTYCSTLVGTVPSITMAWSFGFVYNSFLSWERWTPNKNQAKYSSIYQSILLYCFTCNLISSSLAFSNRRTSCYCRWSNVFIKYCVILKIGLNVILINFHALYDKHTF